MAGFILTPSATTILFATFSLLSNMACKALVIKLCKKHKDYKLLYFYKEGWWSLPRMLFTHGHISPKIKDDFLLWLIIILVCIASHLIVICTAFTPSVVIRDGQFYYGNMFALFPKIGDGSNVLTLGQDSGIYIDLRVFIPAASIPAIGGIIELFKWIEKRDYVDSWLAAILGTTANKTTPNCRHPNHDTSSLNFDATADRNTVYLTITGNRVVPGHTDSLVLKQIDLERVNMRT